MARSTHLFSKPPLPLMRNAFGEKLPRKVHILRGIRGTLSDGMRFFLIPKAIKMVVVDDALCRSPASLVFIFMGHIFPRWLPPRGCCRCDDYAARGRNVARNYSLKQSPDVCVCVQCTRSVTEIRAVGAVDCRGTTASNEFEMGQATVRGGNLHKDPKLLADVAPWKLRLHLGEMKLLQFSRHQAKINK